eukprot:6189401-Pleurochrysis_carterae.AAC.1
MRLARVTHLLDRASSPFDQKLAVCALQFEGLNARYPHESDENKTRHLTQVGQQHSPPFYVWVFLRSEGAAPFVCHVILNAQAIQGVSQEACSLAAWARKQPPSIRALRHRLGRSILDLMDHVRWHDAECRAVDTEMRTR